MENLNFFYPVIRMSLFYAAILGFIIYKYTLTPIRDIKILNNGYFYNKYDDATHIYKIECKKRTGLGSKIKLAKVGDYKEELTKIEEDIYLSKREEEKGIFVTGIAGQGKTVLLNNFIHDIYKQSDNSICILHNVKGDELKFISKFSTYYNISTTRYADEKIHAINYLSLVKDDNPSQQEAKISAFCASFKRPFIKAIRMADGVDVAAADRQYAEAGAVGLLLDSYSPAAPGGTGETFGWDRIPTHLQLPLILAGGLSPDNVAAAIQPVKPYAVDVSSGVESAPGCKSSARITAFVRAARAAAR